jgi:hypothetical protein
MISEARDFETVPVIATIIPAANIVARIDFTSASGGVLPSNSLPPARLTAVRLGVNSGPGQLAGALNWR